MSKIEVDAIDKQSGSTLTLGGSGTAVTLACGATQSGFGRTGTVDWQTSSIKTATFTAESGKGYFCNTAGGTFEVDLPAGSAGAIVSIQDYNNTFDSNELTVDPNGTEKINGGDGGAAITLDTEGQGVTFVYIDATVGWRSVQDNDFSTAGSNNISATGGNTTITCGDFKTHIFTSDGPFNITGVGGPTSVFDYLVVGSGGSGGAPHYNGSGAGGGGAGGLRMFSSAPGSNSPLNAPAGLGASATNLTITVGAGAVGVSAPSTYVSGNNGNVSTFSTITSAGGGGGSGGNTSTAAAGNGGSGGGGGYNTSPGTTGLGNTPPVSPPQGNNGGSNSPNTGGSYAAAGGGGAGAAGGSAPADNIGGAGGSGSYIADPFFGPTAPSYGTPGPVSSVRYFAGGGGGGGGIRSPYPGGPVTGGTAGVGGGGTGGGDPAPSSPGTAGTVNTGGASGGSSANYSPPAPGTSLAGGSGFVAIRYKFQN